jgi:hypothetical protein
VFCLNSAYSLQLLLRNSGEIHSCQIASVRNVFLEQVVVHKLPILFQNSVSDKALFPSVVRNIFDANISRPCVRVDDAQLLVWS